MRAHLTILLLSLSCFAANSASETKPESAASSEITSRLADLRSGLTNFFTNGSWQGRIAVTTSGTMVLGSKGADGKGELGQTLENPMDLSREKYIEVALGVGAQNEVSDATVAFTDAEGTQYTARLRIDQVMPQQAVWLRARLSDFRLNDWDGKRTGMKINWARIKQWHLQGDWKTTAPCQVMFIAMRSRR